MKIFFGPWVIAPSQIFFESPLSYGLVNLKPIVPGHVLIIPKRVVPRFAELSIEEVTDLFGSVQFISKRLEAAYPPCNGLNIAMQDGLTAGQSVPHVHVHILPRKELDFKRNDDVHSEIENQRLDKEFPLDDNRKARNPEAMAEEANYLRGIFPEYRPHFDES